MNGVALYLRYVGASVRAQMQYPRSFLVLNTAQFFGSAIEILGVAALFGVFGRIRGWSLGEVAVFYGVINAAFALADAPTRGFEVFGPEFVRTGAFDRVLLRPRTTALQVLGYELRLRFGRLLQAGIVFAVGASAVRLSFTPAQVLLLAWTLAGGVALFSGILVLQATLSFWTVDALEVANILTYGGVQAGQYPLNVYAAWFRDLLTYVIPIGCVAYFPVVALLGASDPLGAPGWLLPLTPAFGFLFLALALSVWRLGVAKYGSTGS
ncbi:MAG: ABC-2 family transporter protein [Caulobacteraceae bacterium]|nr:ABC-2 family transporter protein [Caulobacteraceae bacterium]